MKMTYGLVSGLLMAMVIAVVGCGGSGGGDAEVTAPTTVDTAALETSMATGDPAAQSDSAKAVTAIKAGDYAGAMTSLNSLAAQAKLTPEQKTAATDLIEAVKKQIEAAGAKAAEEGTKILEEGKKTVDGLVPPTK